MKSLIIPADVQALIERGATLALSLSGGKDGQAMARAVVGHMRKNDYNNKIICIHSHLGKMEWKESLPQCQKIADELGVELIVVDRPGGLMQRMKDRMKKLIGTGKPFWPSSQQRYCTSDTKRSPINKHLRKYGLIISVEGNRAQESKKRAGDPVCQLRKLITSTSYKSLDDLSQVLPNKRFALTWYGIHDWTDEDVFQSYNHTIEELNSRRKLYKDGKHEEALLGWEFHAAYVYGNKRVSCALCVLGSDNDLQVGADHNPELLQELISMEDESGFTFKNNTSLKKYQRAL